MFSRRGHASDAAKHHGGPSTPKSNKHVTDVKAQLPERGQPKRKARLKQSQIDLSMVPAGASSPPQANFGRSHRPGVSSPVDLDDLSTQSGEDDIVSTTVTRRRLKERPIAISSDDSEIEESGLEGPLKKSNHTEVRGSSSNLYASPDHQRKCQLLGHQTPHLNFHFRHSRILFYP